MELCKEREYGYGGSVRTLCTSHSTALRTGGAEGERGGGGWRRGSHNIQLCTALYSGQPRTLHQFARVRVRWLRSHTTCTAHGTLYTPHSTALRTGGAEGERDGGGWSSGSHNILHTVLFSGLLSALHWSARSVASHTAGPGGGCDARSDAGEGRSLYPTRSPAQWTVSRVILPRTLPSFTPRRHGGRAGQNGAEEGRGTRNTLRPAQLGGLPRILRYPAQRTALRAGEEGQDGGKGGRGRAALLSSVPHATLHCTLYYVVRGGRKETEFAQDPTHWAALRATLFSAARCPAHWRCGTEGGRRTEGGIQSLHSISHTKLPCAISCLTRCAVLHTGGGGSEGGRREEVGRGHSTLYPLSC